MSCSIDPSRIARWVNGFSDKEERTALETHVARCPVCERAVSEAARDGVAGMKPGDAPADLSVSLDSLYRIGSREKVSVSPSSTGRFSRRLFAVAASLLLVAGASAWFLRQSPLFETGVEEIRAVGSQGRNLVFPGGASVRIRPESGVSWDRMEEGYRLQLTSGGVEVDVPNRSQAFTVETPNGDVRVLGTVFSVRVLEIPGFRPEDSSDPVTVVELKQGRLQLTNGTGETVLAERQTGLIVSEIPPQRMERGKAPLSERELKGLWSNAFHSFRAGNRSEALLHAAALAAQGETAGRAALVVREEELPDPASVWVHRVKQLFESERKKK